MPHLNPNRAYRLDACQRPSEAGFQVVVAETDLHVVAETEFATSAGPMAVATAVRDLRGALSAYLLVHPEFGRSLSPVPAKPGAPDIAKRMAEAAGHFGVGPMAAVAGTVAQMVGERFDEPNLLIENGGDCYLRSTRERTVGLLADPEAGVRLGLKFQPQDFPLGLCASSGTIGHSISLGRSDVVVVRSASASIADAAATALANMVRGADDLQRALDKAQTWEHAGIDGVFMQAGGQLAAWGRMELAVLE